MSWARYDDNLPMNKKWAKLRTHKVNGAAALGLHVLANTWSRHNGTAGVIETHVPDMLVGGCGTRLANLLVQVGMFDAREAGGWEIHDYAEFHDPNDPNPDRSAADRQREVREKRAEAGRLGGLAKASKTLANASNATAKLQQSSSPEPEPEPEPVLPQVSTQLPPPTECPEGGMEPVDNRTRADVVVDAYAWMALVQAKRTSKVTSDQAYARKAAKNCRSNPELPRLLDLFPTAPAGVIAAALHGEKHSLQHWPRADELATVTELRPA